MGEACCQSNSGYGGGCQNTNSYTSQNCPVCGKRLGLTGDMARIKLYLTCFNCGYRSNELLLEKVRELLD